MKISGFTIIRNGIKFEYPFVESIRSLLPLVDELVVNVGKGDDETLAVIHELAQKEGHGKLIFFESEWPLHDPEKKKSGQILSEQTNLALERCTNDWCIYLQADEVLHEQDYSKIQAALTEAERTPEIEGVLFDYIHFYGSFDVIQKTRSAYRREVRGVRRSAGAVSVGDAQSFRKKDGAKLQVIRAGGARVFHYGWVRPPRAMKEKTFFMDSLYHGENSAQLTAQAEGYLYKRILGLYHFRGVHPPVMNDRIRQFNWNWDFEKERLVWTWKDWSKILLDAFERMTGLRLFEYRSYRLLR